MRNGNGLLGKLNAILCGRTSAGVGGAPPGKGRVTRSMAEAGKSLPASRHTAAIKGSLVSAVDAERLAGHQPAKRRRLRPRVLAHTAFQGAVALLLLVAVVVTLGFSSTQAMPGNPLYPVKRLVEKAATSLEDGAGKAQSHLSQAASRIEELGYSQGKNMDGWYYKLAREAEQSVDVAKSEAAALPAPEAAKVESRAGELVKQHDEAVKQVLPEMDKQDQEQVQQWMERDDDKKPADSGEHSGGKGGDLTPTRHAESEQHAPADPTRTRQGDQGHSGSGAQSE